MKFILTNIGKGTYGNAGIPFTENNFFRIDDDILKSTTQPILGTGTLLDLSRYSGIIYNYSSPLSNSTYTTTNKTINGLARVFIKALQEPVVIGANKIKSDTFTPNSTMEMIVECIDGVSVEYRFKER